MAFPSMKQTWTGLALLSMLLSIIVTMKRQALFIKREDVLSFEAPTERTMPPLPTHVTVTTEPTKSDEFLTQELESDTTPRLPLILYNLTAVDDIKNETATETALTASLQNSTTDVRDEPQRKAPRQSQERKPHTRHGTKAGDTTQLNRTKIVGFINEAYIRVGIRWYDRLTALGYTEHVIVATDNSTSAVLETEYPNYRMEKSYRPPLSQKYANIPPEQKRRKEIEMIFGQRWVYALQQLKIGRHLLITDVDNIFSKYHPMSSMELSEYDVFHALETKYPAKAYNATGFVVCGGMGWFRSTPSTIEFVQLLVNRCRRGTCDDQVKLNLLLAFETEMEWNLTDWHKSFRTKDTQNPSLDGLLEKSFTGVSRRTGHKVMMWDRDFAYRGANDPRVCPMNNWVSMPLVSSLSRAESGKFKYGSYDIWDTACPSGFTNMTTTTVTKPLQAKTVMKENTTIIPLHGKQNVQLPSQDANAGNAEQLNRTKIVGFINEGYIRVGIRWYDRLTDLGYTEHVIIATDNLTAAIFAKNHPQYRIETSLRGPLPSKHMNLTYHQVIRKEIELLFAQRWLYALEQLKAGYHLLMTDVDNIFSKYHPLSSMELSEYDVFHALETKYPEDVFNASGFVVCGGMGWFRSSPRTIEFVQLLVNRCNGQCDDQVKLNSLLAYDMEMEWNLTEWHKSIRTRSNRNPALGGLLEKSFTGTSKKTGHKVLVWDRDFAYRGENNPEVCPVDNWVSMPLVHVRTRSSSWKIKLGSYDIWDATCPNVYSNMAMKTTTTVKLI
jgi:hypothetical protein